jgi:hypothetical protein
VVDQAVLEPKRVVGACIETLDSPDDVKQPEWPKLLQVLGPGLITGASDDDPSGIAN